MQVVIERQQFLGVWPIYHAPRVSATVFGSFSVHVSPCLSVRGTVLVQIYGLFILMSVIESLMSFAAPPSAAASASLMLFMCF